MSEILNKTPKTTEFLLYVMQGCTLGFKFEEEDTKSVPTKLSCGLTNADTTMQKKQCNLVVLDLLADFV